MPLTPQTRVPLVPLSLVFPRQEYCSSRLSFPSTGDLPGLGIEPRSPALQVDLLPNELPGKPVGKDYVYAKPS